MIANSFDIFFPPPPTCLNQSLNIVYIFNFLIANPRERSLILCHTHTLATTTRWCMSLPILFAICLIFSHVPQSILIRRMCILSRGSEYVITLQFYLICLLFMSRLVGHQPAGSRFQVNRHPDHGKTPPKVSWIGSKNPRISFTFGGVFFFWDGSLYYP